VKKYYRYQHTVTAEEIDDLNHAGNYHYIKWMQYASIAHSTANGWSPQRYVDLGAGWVARTHRITYLKPAYEGDSITVKTCVAKMQGAISLRCYEIFNANGEMLATAETDWAFVNYARERPTRIPVEVSSCF
jgi:acyl-CoA thioester hydrolase